MPDQSAKNAERINIDHSMRVLDAIEWRSATSSGSTLVIATTELSAEAVGPFAEQIMGERRTIAIAPKSHWDPITTSWFAGEPIVLLAQGDAGKLACETALAAPGAIRALILADYAPGSGDTSHLGVAVPTLIFHGRQSGDETHAQAVKLHEEIPGSHLIEPEDCGAEPLTNCAEPLAAAVKWFLSELGNPHMDFATGSGIEPVDPRG